MENVSDDQICKLGIGFYPCLEVLMCHKSLHQYIIYHYKNMGNKMVYEYTQFKEYFKNYS